MQNGARLRRARRGQSPGNVTTCRCSEPPFTRKTISEAVLRLTSALVILEATKRFRYLCYIKNVQNGARLRRARRGQGPGNATTCLCSEPPFSRKTIYEAVLRLASASGHLGRVLGQLEGDENDFDTFFSPKMHKMEHAGGEGGEAGAPEMGSLPAARSLSAPSKPSPRLCLGWLVLRVILEVFWVNGKVTKTISMLFYT